MKKYVILLSVAIIIFSAMFIVIKIVDDKYGPDQESQYTVSGEHSDSAQTNFLGSLHGKASEYEVEDDATVDNPEGNYVDEIRITIDGKFSEKDWKIRHEAGLTNQAIAETMKASESKYGYNNITVGQKQLYAEILLVMQNYGVKVPLCSNKEGDLEIIASCVLLDHPEIFYVDGFAYEKYMLLGNVQKITFTPNYTMSYDEVVSTNQMIQQYADICIQGIPEAASEYDKVKYVYEYIISNTEYNVNAPDNQTLCSVFFNRESVCLGYAKAVQYLLQRMDMEVAVVTGSITTGESHAWNLVKVNGQYYYVDATWGDASYLTDSGNGEALTTINYDYLCITTDDLSHTHIIDNPVRVPNCIVRLDNYYVKEDLYFLTLDTLKLETIFSGENITQGGSVSIRFANKEVFDEFQTIMLDEQQIFQYIGGSTTTLAYTTNDQLYTYTFMF